MDLDLEDKNTKYEEKSNVPSPGSSDHGDTLQKDPYITQYLEDKGHKNEMEIGGETLKTMPQATKTIQTPSLSQEELAKMKRINPSRYLEMMIIKVVRLRNALVLQLFQVESRLSNLSTRCFAS